ncbi:MAG TPA: hypothetical protein EYP07_13280 [Kiloniellaceae bacterium]|nr:hypothetical protein [Kiloniellaceae bacterium]
MTVESAEDLAGFFREDEFAVAAVFTPESPGPAEPASVIFVQARDEGGLAEIGITTARYGCRVPVSALSAIPHRWTVEIAGASYRVQKVERDETATQYILPLERI